MQPDLLFIVTDRAGLAVVLTIIKLSAAVFATSSRASPRSFSPFATQARLFNPDTVSVINAASLPACIPSPTAFAVIVPTATAAFLAARRVRSISVSACV